jgi:hypothetical protein
MMSKRPRSRRTHVPAAGLRGAGSALAAFATAWLVTSASAPAAAPGRTEGVDAPLAMAGDFRVVHGPDGLRVVDRERHLVASLRGLWQRPGDEDRLALFLDGDHLLLHAVPAAGERTDVFVAVDVPARRVAWTRRRPGGTAEVVDVARGTALVRGPALFELDLGDGRERWTSAVPSSRPVSAGSTPDVWILGDRACGWTGETACPTRVFGLSRADGHRVFERSLPADRGVPRLASDGAALWVATGARVERWDGRDAATRARFDLEGEVLRIEPRAGGTCVVSDRAIAMLDPTAVRWVRIGRWSLRPGDDALVGVLRRLDGAAETHWLDASTGATTCLSLGGCATACAPVAIHATVEGVLRVNGEAVADATVFVHGQRVTTDRAGHFEAEVREPGDVEVEPEWLDLAREPDEPCVSGMSARVHVQASGRHAVVLDVRRTPPACANGACNADACNPATPTGPGVRAGE